MIRNLHIALCLGAVLGAPASADITDDILTSNVLSGWRNADGTHIAAIKIELQNGWKTYWRHPGESGIPPRFDWSGSRNLKSVEVIWPRPSIYRDKHGQSIGYENQVVLPLRLTPKNPRDVIDLSVGLDLGACRDVCVPVQQALSTVLTNGGDRDPAIVASMASAPFTAAEAGLTHVTCDIRPVNKAMRIEAQFNTSPLGGREYVVFETDNQSMWIEPSQVKREGGALHAHTYIHSETGGFAINRSGIKMTLLGNNMSIEVQGCTRG